MKARGFLDLFLIALLTLLAGASDLWAKAYFMPEKELVTKSTAIAIIELGEPKKAEVKGGHETYRQTAVAKTVQVLKGELPAEFTLNGHEDFICARCELKAGRYLALLSKDRELWVGTNWHLSLRPIRDSEIEWFEKADSAFPLTYQNRETVLKRVAAILNDAPVKSAAQ